MGLNTTQINDEEFFDVKPRKALPDTSLSASEIDDREFFGLTPVAPESTALPVSQGTQLTLAGAETKPNGKKENSFLDVPLPVILGGKSIGDISIRRILKVVEPVLGVFEVPIELMRQKFRDSAVVRGKLKAGEVPSVGDVSKIFFGNPEALVEAVKKVPKEGAVFRELTKQSEVPKEERFSDFIEVLEEVGVPEGPNISPFEKFPVSLRSAAGFGLEAIAPSIPVVKGAKAIRGVTASRKTIKKTVKETIPEASKIIPGSKVNKQTPTKLGTESQRIVSKPVSTGEAIKAPRESKFRETTSARKFDMSKDRETIGLDSLNDPVRKKFQESINNARAKDLDEKAESLADEVLGRAKKKR